MKKILFLSSGVPDTVTETLSDKFEIRKLPPCPELDGPVSTHADMLLGVLDGRIVVTRSYFEENKELFSGCGVIITDEHHEKKYPSDVLFNFIDAGDTAVGYEKALTKAVNKPVVNVKQGYTRCSTLIFGKCAVSADAGILSALSASGYETLEISAGNIVLPGYGYGFIGGASFCADGEVYFFGSLSYHPDGEKIRAFLYARGADIKELSPGPLTDHGGAVILDSP